MHTRLFLLAPLLLTLTLFSGDISPVFAATLSVVPEPSTEIRMDSPFRLSVLLDTEREVINAIEGVLTIPEGLVVDEIRTGRSLITFWIEEPSLPDLDHHIYFSGVTPGGFSMQQASVFDVYLHADVAGTFTSAVRDVSVLRHDGTGSTVALSTNVIPFVVTERGGEMLTELMDDEQPEEFSATIVSDPNLYDGKHVLVFSATDKGSGIARYLIREGWWGMYHEVASPYVLDDQTLRSRIVIRAIDFNGNERRVELSPINPGVWYSSTTSLGVSLVVLVAMVALGWFVWRKLVPSFR